MSVRRQIAFAVACIAAIAAVDDSAAGFADSTSPVFMTDYWPARPLSKLYRRADKSVYLKHVIEAADPYAGVSCSSGSVPCALTPQAGSVYYVMHDYKTASYWDADATIYADTWHLRNTPSTGEVAEIADTYPAFVSGTTNTRGDCTAPCYGRIAVYNQQVIGHGRPGGQTLGVPYANPDIQWWYSPSGDPPYVLLPETPTSYASWSETTLVEKFDSYTPDYGTNALGTFDSGLAPTYSNVVKVLLGHGSKLGSEPICPNQPFAHRAGATSYWYYMWLAPGVGIVKTEILYDEASCDGSAAANPRYPLVAYNAYLDRLQELGSAPPPPPPPPPACTPLPDQVVTNTCPSVGYPANYVGSYVSTRSYSCTTGGYGDWVRNDTCHAPACSPLPDQVVTNTCPSVGYPANYVGSYVSTRSYSCATGGYGDWVRNDTCHAPACSPLPDQVVTNTCPSVGYPANYVGSYVSTRSYSCATGGYGDWVRNDTCHAP